MNTLKITKNSIEFLYGTESMIKETIRRLKKMENTAPFNGSLLLPIIEALEEWEKDAEEHINDIGNTKIYVNEVIKEQTKQSYKDL